MQNWTYIWETTGKKVACSQANKAQIIIRWADGFQYVFPKSSACFALFGS